jgi:hypothetical protein
MSYHDAPPPPQVPRFWLVGYGEDRAPLTPAQVLEDVSEEHARKTVTMEPHPHGAAGVQVRWGGGGRPPSRLAACDGACCLYAARWLVRWGWWSMAGLACSFYCPPACAATLLHA